MADREFLLKFVGDVTDVNKKLGTLDDSVKKTESATSKTAKAIGGMFAVGAVVAFGKSVVSAASDQEQAIGAANSVFKEYAGDIQAFGETTAETLGISNAEFSQLAATTGALLKNAGVPLDETAEATKELTTRAADLAAMYGGSVPDAVAAMSSALKGEMDPLEKYGVSLKATAVEAKAVEMGLVDAEGKVTDYGKAQATVALIMEQSTDAQGTFAKESGTLAGQTAIMSAQFKDLQADLGKKLLPVVVKFAKVLTGLVNFVLDNQGWLLPLGAGILAVVAAMKAWTMAEQAMITIKKIATAAQWAFNAAMTANPIGLIIAAIVALIAIFVLLYTKVDWFREGVDAMVDGVVAAFQWLWDMIKSVYQWIVDNWQLLLAILTGPFGLAIKFIVDNWNTITEIVQSVIDAIVGIMSTVFDILTTPYRLAYDAIRAGINAIPDVFRTVVATVKTVLSTVAEIITAPFRLGWEAMKKVWSTLQSVWNGYVNAIKLAIGVAQSVITAPFTAAWNAITLTWSKAKSMFDGVVSGIKTAFSTLASIIKAPFEAAFKAIKDLWNNTVGGFGFSVPSWVPGVGGKSFKIPKMAKGGIVTGPTIALLGEAGREAVIPLNDRNNPMNGGTTEVTINVYALTANAEVGRKVAEALREYERTTGRAFA